MDIVFSLVGEIGFLFAEQLKWQGAQEMRPLSVKKTGSCNSGYTVFSETISCNRKPLYFHGFLICMSVHVSAIMISEFKIRQSYNWISAVLPPP